MDDVTLQLNEKGHGGFYIREDGKQIGEMVISVSGRNLTVYHTEVAPEAEGRGFAKKLLNAMTEYARKNGLKVIPLCPYVHAQFKRHGEEYADIWNREGEKEEQV
ncbi:MAG TPA: GNAT family N-acetyltransferase [Flavisolibacter sp.]|nr:GNAT family N-acetyltransferase [Flavisolibacter sp.]